MPHRSGEPIQDEKCCCTKPKTSCSSTFLSLQNKLDYIYDSDADKYEQILPKRTDRKEPDADLLCRIEERHLAADSILRTVAERTEEDPCEGGEEFLIVEEMPVCL